MNYQPPRSTVTSAQARPFHPVRLAIGVIAPLLVGLIALVAAPMFKTTFSAFGTDLPWTTRLLLDYPWMLCPTPLPVLALWLAWPGPQRDNVAYAFGVLVTIAAVAYAAFALYQPFFRLGATI